MKILIPLDGSENANHSVDIVMSSLDIYKDLPEILLLNVQWKIAIGNVKLFINPDDINTYYLDQGTLALSKAREILDAANMPYHYHISVGAPAEVIANYAAVEKINQIVMCKLGSGGNLRSRLLGSVVTDVLRLVDCPVLVVS